MTGYKPKLIEVALPLAAINRASAREKSIRHGHPSTVHIWWSPKPLAATRAVIWASLVDDPSCDESLSLEEQEAERNRLFGILERLVTWENSNRPDVLADARKEVDRCFPNGPPPILDPFAGGGAIPLEAQRLGLRALSGDLNPVAVLIQKAKIEIPPRFADRPPVNPEMAGVPTTWAGAQGLAADVAAYGRKMNEYAEHQINYLYPAATSANGESLTPIAWLWARTVESPDPAWRGHVPLVTSWMLANKRGKTTVWIEPTIDHNTQTIAYEIRHGGEPKYPRTVSRGSGICIATGSAIPAGYIKAESRAGRMGKHLMAVVAEGHRGRTYCSARHNQTSIVEPALPGFLPDVSMSDHPRYMLPTLYGIDRWHKLFSARQLVALSTFSSLLAEIHACVWEDALSAGLAEDGQRLRDGGSEAVAYADAIVTYLALAIDKCAEYWSTICTWITSLEAMRSTFGGRQAIPMSWDYAECNPFSNSTGNWMGMVNWICKALNHLPTTIEGAVAQRDARVLVRECAGAMISTDPPYYDNIGYADLSDFFFAWLRPNLADIWPDECATLSTPKLGELVADAHRAGSKETANRQFESEMAEFMSDLVRSQHRQLPATIYYAYKATETKDGEYRATGWDTFLQAVVDSGLQVTATWPMRTERAARVRSLDSNALASSIVLVCRPRSLAAPLASRGEFVGALRAELPEAVDVLQSGNIAPVDMAQSTIGPGMKVFSRYAKVVEADGSSMPVSSALAIINDALGEILDGEETELDAPTRFALTWFSQHGYNPGPSGDADSVARAKNTSLVGIEESGVGQARAGEFRLYERSELAEGWSPMDDTRLTVWEATQYLVLALERSQSDAAALLQRLGGYGDRARQLAYLLFQKASDNGWAAEAGVYNVLITAWPSLRAAELGVEEPRLL